MKMNFSKLLFLNTMVLGILMSISSNNWIMIWCGLEISMVSFIPLMINKMMISSESMMKYFIVQSISSSMLMLSLLIMIMKSDYNYDMMLTTSLMIKMGVSPFHTWVLTVLEGLDFMAMVLMLSLNKIAPLTLTTYVVSSLIMIIMLTIIIGSMMGLNQNSIKKLIGYSSVYNMGFVLSVIKNNMMWMFYMMVYSLMLFMMTSIIYMYMVKYTNQMMFSETILNKLIFWTTMLSMGGMPPMMGFSIKYMVISSLILMKMNVLITFMVMSSLMIMFFYLRMTFLSIMNSSMLPMMNLFKKNKLPMWIMLINMSMTPMLLMTKMFS